ncbi:MAG: cation:proton antiporter [Nitrospinae bacterium]|nr:cation:proton antiporter [Nitrospinota bacterium]
MEWIYQLAWILIAAKIAGELSRRVGLSPMIGEILAGVFLGGSFLGLLEEGPMLDLFAEMGIIFMIFLIGLETNVEHILKVGRIATLVAVAGIAVPFVGGFLLGEIAGYPRSTSLFLGSILTATSVAVTTRVFMDLGKVRARVSQTILAAAIVDDVLGLLVLSLVLAFTGSGEENPGSRLGMAALFLLVISPLGWWAIPRLIRLARKIEEEGAIFALTVGLTFLFAYLSHEAGLASLIGAFVMGLILGQVQESQQLSLDIRPLYYFMAPIFFVSIGVHVDFEAFYRSLGFAVILSLLAIVTKLLGGMIGALGGGYTLKKGLLIGVGMIPRGEVGLIVAGIGIKLGLIDKAIFAASAFMCLLTVLVPPLFIKPLAKAFPEELED